MIHSLQNHMRAPDVAWPCQHVVRVSLFNSSISVTTEVLLWGWSVFPHQTNTGEDLSVCSLKCRLAHWMLLCFKRVQCDFSFLEKNKSRAFPELLNSNIHFVILLTKWIVKQKQANIFNLKVLYGHRKLKNDMPRQLEFPASRTNTGREDEACGAYFMAWKCVCTQSSTVWRVCRW